MCVVVKKANHFLIINQVLEPKTAQANPGQGCGSKRAPAQLDLESRRLDLRIPGSLRLSRGTQTAAHARRAEQAMPPGPTLDRGG
jgi:hypothetical protein